MGQKAAIYCRVSTSDQNCDRQERDLLTYADRCGYEVVEVFKETASGSKNDRQLRRKVVELARARDIEVILCSELTRWGRSTSDLISSLHELHSWNVSLIAQSGFQFDLATPHGKLIAGVMASMAEFERDLLRERVNSGLANARARGQKLGRPRGGKTRSLCPQIRERFKQGRSVRSIAAELKISKSSVDRCRETSEGMNW